MSPWSCCMARGLSQFACRVTQWLAASVTTLSLSQACEGTPEQRIRNRCKRTVSLLARRSLAVFQRPSADTGLSPGNQAEAFLAGGISRVSLTSPTLAKTM